MSLRGFRCGRRRIDLRDAPGLACPRRVDRAVTQDDASLGKEGSMRQWACLLAMVLLATAASAVQEEQEDQQSGIFKRFDCP